MPPWNTHTERTEGSLQAPTQVNTALMVARSLAESTAVWRTVKPRSLEGRLVLRSHARGPTLRVPPHLWDPDAIYTNSSRRASPGGSSPPGLSSGGVAATLLLPAASEPQRGQRKERSGGINGVGQNTPQRWCCAMPLMKGWLRLYGAGEIKTLLCRPLQIHHN